MLVARYYNNKNVRIESAEKPQIRDGEVLVRVMSCGICGSDVMEWFRVPKSPRILGHEIAGVVAESRSDRFVEGERVVVRNQVPCGICHACANGHHSVCEASVEIEPGGMAEFIRVPRQIVERGMWRLPNSLPYPVGTLAEPLACVLHSQNLALTTASKCLVIVGCGVFGLLHLQVARHSGVQRIIVVEPNEYRQAVAINMGATAVVNSADGLVSVINEVNNGHSADMSIVATGSSSGLATACKALPRFGTVLLFGIPPPNAAGELSINQIFWRKELVLLSSYGPGNVAFSEALRLLQQGAINFDQLITHEIPFGEVQSGFELASKAADSLKIVLDLGTCT